MLTPEEMKHEEEYLSFVKAQIEKHLAAFGDEAEKLRRLTREQREFIWENREAMDLKENYFEEVTAMRSTESFGVAFNEAYRLSRMLEDPYFGRIDFLETGETKAEKIYIGTGSLVDQKTYDVYVYDWRSPIAGMYYDFEQGPSFYHCEAGKIAGEITLKRQYKIRDGEITEAFDSSVTVLDEILQSILSADAQEKMRPVVTTIQKEQNAMIREEDAEIFVIQGAAGSGKTSVALHRIAYLLYRRRNKLNEKNIVILSPNDYFSDYISGVLPELGEKNVREQTFHRLTSGYFPKDVELEDLASFMERVYTGKLPELELSFAQEKAERRFAEKLEEAVSSLVREGPPFADFKDADGTVIFPAGEMRSLYLNCLPAFTVSQRMEQLTTRFAQKMEDYKGKKMASLRRALLEKNGVNYYLDARDLEKDARLLWMQQYHALSEGFAKHILLDEYGLYRSILSSALGKAAADRFDAEFTDLKRLSYPDIAPLAYLKLMLGKERPENEVLHVVVDEAQDYNYLHYRLFARKFPNARFTILGDCFQLLSSTLFNSAEGFGYILEAFDGRKGRLGELKKRYRSTTEINAFADRLVGIHDESNYVERHGEEPKREKVWDEADFVKRAFEEAGEQNCAVIVKTQKQALALYQKLRGVPGVTCVDNENTTHIGRRMIIPSYLAKGLEFDWVVVLTDGFTEEDQKLLYICCTRALHKLDLIGTE